MSTEMVPVFSSRAAVLSDYDSADLEENASHSEVKNCLKPALNQLTSSLMEAMRVRMW